MVKINTMGSEVVDGFECKPKNADPNKPIMYFKYQIMICDGDRCNKLNDNLANELRKLLEELNLNKGKNRIKITRTYCFGACRFKQVAQIIENSKDCINNCLILKNVHEFNIDKWKKIFLTLSQNKPLSELDIEFVPMQESK